MPDRWKLLALRAALLFVLSMVLVFGFWEHRNFYQIGLYNLLLVGGFVTFLVILAFRVVFSGELPRGRPAGDLTFTPDEGDRIVRRLADVAVRPAASEWLPTVGDVVRARYDAGAEFARVRITDGRRVYLADLTDEDAKRAGYGSADELRRAGAPRWRWRSMDVVVLLSLETVGVRR